MEEMLLMAVQSSNVLFVFEVLPADDTFFLTMIKACSKPILAHCSKHIDLMIKVFKSVNVLEDVLLNDILEHKKTLDNDKQADQTKTKHHHIQKVMTNFPLLKLLRLHQSHVFRQF